MHLSNCFYDHLLKRALTKNRKSILLNFILWIISNNPCFPIMVCEKLSFESILMQTDMSTLV